MREAVWPLVSAAEMRALDAHTIGALGVPGDLLMESAGRAVAAEILALGGGSSRVIVACGRGNNGGDGLVVARHLHALGVEAAVWPVGAWTRAVGDASPEVRANWERARAFGVPVVEALPTTAARVVVVDAIFGTGLSRPVAGPEASAIEGIAEARRAGARVVAIDVPSGLDADTGQALGALVEADVTVTIGLPKLGLALEPGRSAAGRIVVARIGIADTAPGARRERDPVDARPCGRRAARRARQPGTRASSVMCSSSPGARARPGRRRWRRPGHTVRARASSLSRCPRARTRCWRSSARKP